MTRPAQEHGIPMSKGNPQAILIGRKTQTRRHVMGDLEKVTLEDCPYGGQGDRLWVREKHWLYGSWWAHEDGSDRWSFKPLRDQGVKFDEPTGLLPNFPRIQGCYGWYERPGMFMPRWACRTLLEITEVRLQPLQDISEHDAICEGILRRDVIVDTRYEGGIHTEITEERYFFTGCTDEGYGSAVEAYAGLWDAISGRGGWDKNPRVWAINFKRVKP